MKIRAYKISCSLGVQHIYASTDRSDVEFEIKNIESFATSDTNPQEHGFCTGRHTIATFELEFAP